MGPPLNSPIALPERRVGLVVSVCKRVIVLSLGLLFCSVLPLGARAGWLGPGRDVAHSCRPPAIGPHSFSQPRWIVKTGGRDSWATILRSDGAGHLVVAHGNVLLAYDMDGHELWRREFHQFGARNIIEVAVAPPDRVVVVVDDIGTLGLSLADGSTVWSNGSAASALRLGPGGQILARYGQDTIRTLRPSDGAVVGVTYDWHGYDHVFDGTYDPVSYTHLTLPTTERV